MQTPAYRVTATQNGNASTVTVHADGVDRTEVCSWEVPAKLASRFVKAIEAGAVLEWNGIRTDVVGKTYWSTSSKVLARMLNADLKRMGF